VRVLTPNLRRRPACQPVESVETRLWLRDLHPIVAFTVYFPHRRMGKPPGAIHRQPASMCERKLSLPKKARSPLRRGLRFRRLAGRVPGQLALTNYLSFGVSPKTGSGGDVQVLRCRYSDNHRCGYWTSPVVDVGVRFTLLYRVLCLQHTEGGEQSPRPATKATTLRAPPQKRETP
jgi:hypothetical protein